MSSLPRGREGEQLSPLLSLGGVQITLRGNNLGSSREDVMRVGVAGVDCTHSLEYFSSYKIVVTCSAVPFPCSGPVVVETDSGGIGMSGMHFSFVDEDTLGTKVG